MVHVRWLAVVLVLIACSSRICWARSREAVVAEIENAKLNGVVPAFVSWQAKFGLSFVNSSTNRTASEEYVLRLSIFNATVEFCYAFNNNASNANIWMGLGPFSHLSQAEFDAPNGAYHGTRGPYSASGRKLAARQYSYSCDEYKDYNKTTMRDGRSSSIPTDFNWAQQANVLAPVQDQGECGSSWAFATLGALESLIAIKHAAPVVPLSVQESISCGFTGVSDPTYSCNGNRYMEDDFMNIEAYLGRQPSTSASYPYVGVTNTTFLTTTNTTRLDTAPCNVTIKGGVVRDSGQAVLAIGCFLSSNLLDTAEEEALHFRQAVANQPVMVAVSAGAPVWQHYQGGVMTDAAACQTGNESSENQAALLVGYNMTASRPYWIVKNSWGTQWGDGGYIALDMFPNSTTYKPSTCNVLKNTWIPVVADPSPPPAPPSPFPGPPLHAAALQQWRTAAYWAFATLALAGTWVMTTL